MGSMVRSCVQSLLKLVNSVIGMVGVAMILYSVWMFRVWQRHMDGPDYPAPWFIYTFLGVGVSLCVITCSGHIAAETANGKVVNLAELDSLSTGGLLKRLPVLSWSWGYALVLMDNKGMNYMLFVFLLLLLEAAVTVDVFLNRDWEEDFPEDPTGKLGDLKNFIKENFQICKWIGLSIVATQGLCMIFSMILKALGPHRKAGYESDDDYTPEGVPLLKNYIHQPPYVAGVPPYGSRKDSWNVRINK